MSKRYHPWSQDQSYLLPPSLRDWLPEEHLAWAVLDAVGELDLSRIEAAIQERDARGQRPYHPQMMVALLIYGYSTGVYSSRRLERACYEDVGFRVLTGNTQPHFTTINEFRRVHRAQFAELFVQGLQLCGAAGMVNLGHIAVDGSKVAANASKHKAMSYERMKREEERLRQEVERLLEQAEARDAAEDEAYGEGERGEELPEELRRRESRLARIREAKRALEEQAKHQRATQLREQAEANERKAREHPDETVRRRLETRAANQRRQAEQLDPSDDGPPDGGGGAATQLVRRPAPTTPEATPPSSAQRNFTDPDSSIMNTHHGFVQAYNAQIGVDVDSQVILANGVTDQPPDAQHLLPILKRTRVNLGRAAEVASADAGYWHPEAPAKAAALGTEVLIATARERRGKAAVTTEKDSTDAERSAREQMRRHLATPRARALYARRKSSVEPVFGQIKEARGFRRFSFRGLGAVDAEWNLVCLCHNLLKLIRHRGEENPQPALA